MNPLFFDVSLTCNTGATLKVGELAATNSKSEFMYSPDASMVSIDPINLPIQKTPINYNEGLMGVFEDALPDQWGRRVMVSMYKLPRSEQAPHKLLQYLDGNQFGALSFHSDTQLTDHQTHMEKIESLGELTEAVDDFEKNNPLSENRLLQLFNAGGSAGGAHPKLSLVAADNTPILIKLASLNDRYDIVGLEAASLHLASLSGIDVPSFDIVNISKKKRGLQLSRFDVAPNNSGRFHMISMQSLLNAKGFYRISYKDMACVLKRVSIQPEIDLLMLYRQMVFNAAIGNTDDHLKNFSMMHDGNGYKLTPAYDILPNVNNNMDHTLSFLDDTITPRHSMLVGTILKDFSLAKSIAVSIVDEICTTIESNLLDVFHHYQVDELSTAFFKTDILGRTKKITGG